MNNFLLVDQLCGFAASRGSHSTRSLSNSMLASGEEVLRKGTLEVKASVKVVLPSISPRPLYHLASDCSLISPYYYLLS